MTRRIAFSFAAASIAAGGLLVCNVAAADLPTPSRPHGEAPARLKAAELFKSGEARYKASDYAGALADFVAADEEVPGVETARYIGLCEDKLGHYRAAAAAYNRFLAHPPALLVDEVGPLVVRVRDIERMAGTVRIDCPGHEQVALVSIDGAATKYPVPYEAELSPGKHLVRAVAPGHITLEREVEVGFASTQKIELALEDEPAPPPPAPAPLVVAPSAAPPAAIHLLPSPPPPPAVTRRMVAWGAAGVAFIGAGVATSFGVLALHNKSLYQSQPTLSNSDHGNNDAAYADGGIALAVAAGVTSLILFLTDDSSVAAAKGPATRGTALEASPFVGPHGGGASAAFRF